MIFSLKFNLWEEWPQLRLKGSTVWLQTGFVLCQLTSAPESRGCAEPQTRLFPRQWTVGTPSRSWTSERQQMSCSTELKEFHGRKIWNLLTAYFFSCNSPSLSHQVGILDPLNIGQSPIFKTQSSFESVRGEFWSGVQVTCLWAHLKFCPFSTSVHLAHCSLSHCYPQEFSVINFWMQESLCRGFLKTKQWSKSLFYQSILMPFCFFTAQYTVIILLSFPHLWEKWPSLYTTWHCLITRNSLEHQIWSCSTPPSQSPWAMDFTVHFFTTVF